MLLTIYAAGPEVFLPHGAEISRRKAGICARHGIHLRAPIDNDVDISAADASGRIYRHNLAMMLGCDAIVANLTPFRGPSADDGTAFELGYFDALRRPAFAYSNAAEPLAERTRAFLAREPDRIPLAIEDFGLAANLMLPHAVLERGGLPMFTPAAGGDRPLDDRDTFELLVAAIAERCAPIGRLRGAAAAVLGSREAAAQALRLPLPALLGATALEAVIADPSREEWLVQLLGRP